MKPLVCCKRFMELKAVYYDNTSITAYPVYVFQCKKCGNINQTPKE